MASTATSSVPHTVTWRLRSTTWTSPSRTSRRWASSRRSPPTESARAARGSASSGTPTTTESSCSSWGAEGRPRIGPGSVHGIWPLDLTDRGGLAADPVEDQVGGEASGGHQRKEHDGGSEGPRNALLLH